MKIKEIGFKCWLFERKRRFYNNLWILRYNFKFVMVEVKNDIKLKLAKAYIKMDMKLKVLKRGFKNEY